MSTSRGSALALGIGLAAGACTPAAHEMRHHPIPLAGDWLDLEQTTARDTSIWRLAPDGADLTVHVVMPARAGMRARERRPTHHGLWFLRGALGDTAARALCFSSRPGRNPIHCVRFALDTLADGTRQLRLRDYHGTRTVADRTLVERRP